MTKKKPERNLKKLEETIKPFSKLKLKIKIPNDKWERG
ncbi:hypothetical protein LCGC14_1742210 [marine sediment metagenome]|uniref:Uncharacterized protein n=1 Tax=marine sediment metagenome TaxID=412755 RepID=A0A0F9K616_9ZZZZ